MALAAAPAQADKQGKGGPAVSLTTPQAKVGLGKPVRLKGEVKRWARGQRVVLLAKPAGARKWSRAGATKLAGNGRFSFKVTPPLGRTAYRAVAQRRARAPKARSRAVRVLGLPGAAATLSLEAGAAVRLGGLLPTRLRRKVVLQRLVGGRWERAGSRRSTTTGRVFFRARVTASTAFRLYAPRFRVKSKKGKKASRRTATYPPFTSPRVEVDVLVAPPAAPAPTSDDSTPGEPSPPPPGPEASPPVVLNTPSPAPGPSDDPAPNPEDSASDLPAASASSLRSATAFLYTGADPVQEGVAPETIETKRSAVLRGRVTNRIGSGIGGVRVTVADHPEYGRTATRVDGGYEMAVNGGGPLTLVFEREGWIPAQRQVEVPWQDYAAVDPLVLVPYDNRATRIDTSGSGIVAVQASTVDDSAGERTQTLLFSPGTAAEMRVAGTYQPIGETFTVRSTEFTQGASGIDAMPGQLPRATAYTYAAEFSLDEAAAAQATNVRFSKPVATYLDNFLGLPVGAAVPAGYYDREREEWVGAPNGRVVKVVSGGIDTDGDGTADDSGIGAAERDEVLALYPPGTELWRVEVTHFTPWDYNYPYGPPEDTTEPPPTIGPREKKLLGGPDASIGPAEPPGSNPCPEKGSIIRCDDQVLGERLPIAGTPLELVYASDRVPGRLTGRTIEIVLRDGTLPESLEAIDLEIDVAGRTFEESFTPAEAEAEPVYEFTWDGLDAYGRRVYGAQVAEIAIGYRYPAVYQAPADFQSSWAQVSGVPITGDRSRQDFTLWKRDTAAISSPDVRGSGFGGWTISEHHEYDPTTHTLRLGDGRISGATTNRLAALQEVDASPALDRPTALATAPDGATWIADTRNQLVRRVAVDGTVTTVAGTGDYGYRSGDDGGPATSARLSAPQALSVVDGGEGATVAYVADTNANRIRMIAADGTITTVAGGGSSLGDGGPATAARLSVPQGVVAAPDGALYVADTGHHRIRMIGTDGQIATVAGDGTAGFEGDGGAAADARLRGPTGLALDADGRLLIADTGNGRVRRIGLDGTIETVIGGGDPGDGVGDGELATAAKLDEPAGLAVGRGGELIVADAGSGRVRMVDEAGTIRTIAGGGGEAFTENAPAAAVDLTEPTGVTISPDQALVVSEPGADRVSHVQELMPGFSDGDLLIPSEDGSLVFQFDAEGLHRRTLDALTGAVLRRFAYDAEGRLTGVYDDAAAAAQPHSPLLTVERPDADTVVLHTRGGRETELALDENGWLDSVTDPAGEVQDLTHDPEGLLTGEEDAEGGTHSFEYDALGRLEKDTGPDGAFKTLTAAEIADGRQVTMETSGGQTTVYRDTLDAEGNRVHSVVAPSGATATTTRRPDGTVETVREDGTEFAQRFAPDPRFGMQAPYVALTRTTTPGGRSRTLTATRSVTMRNATKVESAEDTYTFEGNTSTRTYTANPGEDGGTLVRSSPEGREETTELDDHGRIESSRAAEGIQVATTVYDDAHDGRIATQSLGDRGWTYEYDARNRVTKRTDAEGNETTYTYDAADRLLTTTRDGTTYTAEYDEVGRRTGLETPGGATSTFTYTPTGLAHTLTLPGTDPYERAFNEDGQLTGETLPSGDTLGQTFDGAHRLGASAETRDGAGSPLLERSWEYDGATGLVTRLTRSAGAIEQHLDRAYDGQLPTEVAFAGPAAGSFSFTTSGTGLEYDSLEVDAGSGGPRTYAISRDDDQLVTGLGPFEIERDAATARAESFTDAAEETVVQTLDTEGYGELDERHVSAEETEVYALTLQRDKAGRVVRREEQIAGGGAIVRVYVYDGLSRLVRVEDGSEAVVEEYAYDADGNRTSATAPDHAAQTATYDGATGLQTAAGPLTLSFGEDGFLTERGGEEFTYAPSGELLEAEAGGETVTYGYDGLGRMVRRVAGSEETNYLYGNPKNALEVTATTDETGELTTYFYDEFGHLHAIERGGARYRVGADQVGTPRVVVDGEGNVVKQVDRDTYGRVLADSDPGFELPIGYAGGIEDPDTGLVRFGARDYDPQTGRFTARDPSLYRGSPANLFAYADSTPSDQRDPTGLDTWAASLYYGIGGGLSFSRGADGTWSVCGEYGFGLAGGAEFDPLGQPENGQSLVREVSSGIKAGPVVSVDGSFSIENPLPAIGDPCPEPISQDELTDRSKVTLKGGGSFASFGVVGSVDSNGNTAVQGTRSFDLGVSGGAKGAYKDCIQMKGSLW